MNAPIAGERKVSDGEYSLVAHPECLLCVPVSPLNTLQTGVGCSGDSAKRRSGTLYAVFRLESGYPPGGLIQNKALVDNR
jgi:hypothetical protein